MALISLLRFLPNYPEQISFICPQFSPLLKSPPHKNGCSVAGQGDGEACCVEGALARGWTPSKDPCAFRVVFPSCDHRSQPAPRMDDVRIKRIPSESEKYDTHSRSSIQGFTAMFGKRRKSIVCTMISTFLLLLTETVVGDYDSPSAAPSA